MLRPIAEGNCERVVCRVLVECVKGENGRICRVPVPTIGKRNSPEGWHPTAQLRSANLLLCYRKAKCVYVCIKYLSTFPLFISLKINQRKSYSQLVQLNKVNHGLGNWMQAVCKAVCLPSYLQFFRTIPTGWSLRNFNVSPRPLPRDL